VGVLSDPLKGNAKNFAEAQLLGHAPRYGSEINPRKTKRVN